MRTFFTFDELDRNGLYNPVQLPHGVKHSMDRAVGFLSLPNGGNEFDRSVASIVSNMTEEGAKRTIAS